MSYYNTDENTTPAPGTDHKLNDNSFEQWKKQRDAKLAASGWNRTKLRQSVITERQEIKNRKQVKR